MSDEMFKKLEQRHAKERAQVQRRVDILKAVPVDLRVVDVVVMLAEERDKSYLPECIRLNRIKDERALKDFFEAVSPLVAPFYVYRNRTFSSLALPIKAEAGFVQEKGPFICKVDIYQANDERAMSDISVWGFIEVEGELTPMKFEAPLGDGYIGSMPAFKGYFGRHEFNGPLRFIPGPHETGIGGVKIDWKSQSGSRETSYLTEGEIAADMKPTIDRLSYLLGLN